ncbi:cytochrome ubiquinol oxidase subunit I [Acidianus manzaensis]|uniref:Cytochrome ubiquinol oxidase subunit I n=1 Tax=Acidianus manzaensis TaxID=282676 RepID=A0A1W6K2W7_9CREN|nr:cytochrome ubiquinol oxidase subunit I [Acidianus manzaensis]ARM76901.1 cytochrome ubiquinol oxidase subunit I [Acidianus manzaensis]
MDLFIFDRVLAAFTMGTHMLFTYWAISLPFFIVFAEYLGYKKNDPYYLALAKRFSTVMAVLFAVGSAAGAAIAVEFITVWYKWMFLVNEVDILPFEIEVMAFFSEVIFLSLYLYGWNKMSRNAHMVLGALVGMGSSASAVLIVLVNSWMNTPNGFNVEAYVQSGELTGINPLAALWPPAATAEVPMVLAGAWFVGFGSLVGYFSFRKIFSRHLDTQSKEYYNRGLKLASYLAALDAIFLGWAGDNAGKTLYQVQPLKLATLEGVMQTAKGAPMTVGPISIPGVLSLLSTWPPNPNALVLGYSSFVSSVQDPIWWMAHDAYDLHATLGILGAIIFWILALAYLKPSFGKAFSWLGLDNPTEKKLPLYVSFLIGWLQLIAWESGWVAAETGRQPFVIWGPMTTTGGLYTIQAVMLTSEGYNTNPDVLPIGIAIMTALVIAVAGTLYMLKRLFSGKEISQDVASITVSGISSTPQNPQLPSIKSSDSQTSSPRKSEVK